MASRLPLFFAELKRRKVYRVAAVCAAVGAVISLGAPDLFGAFDLPSSAARLVIVLIAIGFPIPLGLAYPFPESLCLTSDKPDAIQHARSCEASHAVFQELSERLSRVISEFRSAFLGATERTAPGMVEPSSFPSLSWEEPILLSFYGR
jgi:hypothetical protein